MKKNLFLVLLLLVPQLVTAAFYSNAGYSIGQSCPGGTYAVSSTQVSSFTYWTPVNLCIPHGVSGSYSLAVWAGTWGDVHSMQAPSCPGGTSLVSWVPVSSYYNWTTVGLCMNNNTQSEYAYTLTSWRGADGDAHTQQAPSCPGGTSLVSWQAISSYDNWTTVGLCQRYQSFPPTCAISLSPNPINKGAGSTLSWSSSNATSFYIANVGYVGGSGSTTVAPSVSTAYTGSVSGPGGSAGCSGTQTLTVYQSCSFNGATLSHGQSVPAYQNSSVPYGGTCTSQTRTCSNGTLSGSYAHASCSVTPAANCTLNGVTVPHGQSQTFYSAQTSPIGQLCSAISQSRTCTNGTLSGSATYQYGSCTCAPIYSCSSNNVRYTNSSCATSTVATCVAPSFCSAGQSTCQSPPPAFNEGDGTTGHLQARPSLVGRGLSTKLYWDVSNVSSCAVAGSSGDSWTGLTSGASGRTSSAITQQTTFTLSCVALTGHSFTPETATVNVTPIFQEN